MKLVLIDYKISTNEYDTKLIKWSVIKNFRIIIM